jgi:hypothetical protein
MHAGEPIEAVVMRGRLAIEERVTFARVLKETPRRSYEEILADTVHVFDVKARELLVELEADETVTPEQYLELVDRQERAGRWALRGLDADVRERLVRVSEGRRVLAAVATGRRTGGGRSRSTPARAAGTAGRRRIRIVEGRWSRR